MKKRKRKKTFFQRFYGILKIWAVVWLTILTHFTDMV